MINKFLMVTLYVMIGFQSMAAIQKPNMTSRVPASASSADAPKNICMMHSGDVGKLKYKGTSMENALRRVADACIEKREKLYIQAKKAQPSDEYREDLVLACVNSIKCI